MPVARFRPGRDRWEGVHAAAVAERSTLTLATFNVWFGDHDATQRYHAIADVLRAHQPDVIVCQEVTPKGVPGDSRRCDPYC